MRQIHRLFPALVLLTLLFAIACGGDNDEEDPNTSDPTPTPAAEAFPVTIEHKFGNTTIDEEPERVIALGYVEQDPLLALGVKPIATRYWFGDAPFAVFPWAQDELGDAEPEVLNMTFGELDFEAIAALEPDLISAVYAGITEEEYTTLSQIAPTIAQSGEYIDFGMPWQEGTVVIGRAVGEETKAIKLVEALQAEFEAVRQAHPDWQGKSVAVVAPGRDGGGAIFGSGDLRSRVFIDLGFEVPEEFEEITGESFYAEVSMERADLFDQDLVIVHQLSYYEGGEEALRADPLWNSLDAVKEGRAVYIEESLDQAYGFNSVLSMEYFFDGILPQVEAALGGGTGGGETRVIEDLFGEVEIPVNPRRVVAGASISLGNMLALGVKPVAAAVNPNSLPVYLEGQMEGIEDVRGENGIDPERVLALDPDLLISFGGSVDNPFREEQCTLWKQALPTFCYEYWYAYEEEIKKNLTEVARALNLEERGEEVIAEYDARIEELRQKVLAVGFDDKPVSVVRVFQDGNYSIRIGTSESIIFRDIGIPQPDGQRNPDDFAVDLSEENLDVLNESYAVLVYIDDNSDTTEEQIRSSEVWQLLTPVQEGRLVFVNSGIWNSIDLLGAHAIMDDIENLVLPLAEE